MDKLKEIFEIQNKFTKKLFKEKFNIDDVKEISNNSKQRVKWSKEYIISVQSKAIEFLEQMNWKMHLDKNEMFVKDNYLEIGVDILKYTFGLLIINGFNDEEIYNKFLEKSEVVEEKVRAQAAINNIKRESYKKIAFVDIDGVMGNWTKKYLSFINNMYGTNYDNLYEAEHGFTDLQTKYITKKEFRISGLKRELELMDDAKLFLDKLKENNYYIVLVTARPYKQVNKLYYDTMVWLKNNNLQYDTVIFDEQKEKFIIDHFSNTRKYSFIIDDDIDNCNRVSKNGFTTYFKYNEISYKKDEKFEDTIKKLNSNVMPIKNLSEMLEELNLK